MHTYIDKKSPELTYAAIAALKKSYEDAGQNVLLVDAGDHIQAPPMAPWTMARPSSS